MHVFSKWVVGFLFAFSAVSANAQAVHGVLRVVKGDVQIKSGKDGKTAKARVGEKVFPKDTIITLTDSRAKIVMVDNNEINVSPDSQIEIQNYEFDPAAGKKEVLLNVIYGKVRNKVEQKYDGKTSKFQVKTPSAVAGVRGTDFVTSVEVPAGAPVPTPAAPPQGPTVTNVVTFEGNVQLGTPGPNGAIQNPVSVTPGTTASVTPSGTTPPAPVPKDQLAKMDGETKADSKGGGENKGGNDQRTPAGDGKDKSDKKEDKKDDSKGNKGADGGDKNKGGGNDKNGNNGGKGDGSGSGGGKGANAPGAGGAGGAGGTGGSNSGSNSGSGSDDKQSNNGGTAPSSDGGSRSPSSTGGGGMPPAGGGCVMCDKGPAAPPPVADLPPPPPPVIELPKAPITEQPQLPNVNEIGGKANLTINVITN